MAARILIVEDETIVALDLEARLEGMDYTVVGRARDSESAVALALKHSPDIILMDIQIAGTTDGISTAEIIQGQIDVPVLFLTAYSDANNLERAKKTDAYGYLLKPFQERELFITVEMVLYRHRTERTMRTTAALLETTVNAVSEGIVATDATDHVILVNPAAENLTGWTLVQARGKHLDEVVRMDEQTGNDPNRPGKVWWLQHRDGGQREVEVFRKQVSDTRGDLDRNVLVLRDVTTIREYERSLVEAKRSAEIASKTKSEFIARVSHELKTPLNVIQGMIGLVRDEEHSPESAENLSIAAASCDDLRRQIQDVLDFSALDSGERSLQPEAFIPRDIVMAAAEKIRPRAMEKALRLAVVAPPELSGSCRADWRQLTRAIDNLVANAVSFTASGTILIVSRLDRQDTPGSPGRLTVRVEDTGPGIPPEDRERVFDDFSQLAPSRTRSVGGSGLGLAMARRVVLAMRGEITIAGRNDGLEGTVATVSVPVTPEATEADRSVNLSALRGMHLIVTDPLAAEVLLPWQESGGFILDHPGNGTERAGGVRVLGSSRWVDTEQYMPLTMEALVDAIVGAVSPENEGLEEPVDTKTVSAGAMERIQEAIAGGDRQAAMEYLAEYRAQNGEAKIDSACFRAYLALRSGDLPAAARIIQRCAERRDES